MKQHGVLHVLYIIQELMLWNYIPTMIVDTGQLTKQNPELQHYNAKNAFFHFHKLILQTDKKFLHNPIAKHNKNLLTLPA